MLVVLRILRTGDQRLWLLVGLLVGVSLYAKHTILFLVIALLVGFVVNRQWKVLRSPYLWIGAGIAVLLWVPNLLWQADHGWPTLAMSGGAAGEALRRRLHGHVRHPAVRAAGAVGRSRVAGGPLGAAA